MKNILKNKILIILSIFVILTIVISSNSFASSSSDVSFSYSGIKYNFTINDFLKTCPNRDPFFVDGFNWFVIPSNLNSDGEYSSLEIRILPKGSSPYLVSSLTNDRYDFYIYVLDDTTKTYVDYFVFNYNISNSTLRYSFFGNVGYGFYRSLSVTYDGALELAKSNCKNFILPNGISTYNTTFPDYPESEVVFQQAPQKVEQAIITEITQVEEIPQMMGKVMEMIIPIGLIIFGIGLIIFLIRLVILRLT